MEYEKLTTEYLNYLMNKLKMDPGYYELCKTLQSINFIPILDMDENRSCECRELRDEFIDYKFINHPEEKESNGDILKRALPYSGTYMELLVVLAFYISYNLLESEYDSEPQKWFFELLENCGIFDVNDYVINDLKRRDIRNRIDLINIRRFNWDGEGSFFPLRFPHSDQRYEEIIVQANNYIEENYDIC